MDTNVNPNGKSFGPDLGKALVASAALGVVSVLAANAGHMIMNKIYDWKDNQKSSNFGFSRK